MYLITGGAGFIGSHLVDKLIERGEPVVCLDDFNDFYDRATKLRNIGGHREHPLYTLVEGDIRDSALLESLFQEHRFMKVVHLAARAGVRPSLQNPLLYEDVNVRGTLNLLEVSRKHDVKQFIFASSSSVYGDNSKTPFHEDDPIRRPVSPYAATKYAAELMCYTYHHLYGMPTSILRFFSVYGPRQRPDMAIHKFVTAARRDEPIPVFGDGSTARDYTYIDDILQGLLAAIARPFPFEVFNLGNSFCVSLSDLVSELKQACGQEIQIERQPMQPGDVERTWADISKARAMLGYNPSTNIRDGLSKFVRWFDGEARVRA